MVSHNCNPRTGEMEAGGWWVQGQPELNSEPFSEKKSHNQRMDQ
jgi:hypothetical protein